MKKTKEEISLFKDKKPKDKAQKKVIIYTDGACLGNPGPGGYGVVLRYGKHFKELSKGFRYTTNNRMEILAAVEALRALKSDKRLHVVIHSDSQLLVKSINEGWAEKWRKNDWKRNRKDKALNADLWAMLLQELEKHDVGFVWVKGHADIPDNERCDRLSKDAAESGHLLIDEFYESENSYKSKNK